MRAEGSSKATGKKSRKSVTPHTSKLKISENKFSKEFKAKFKARINNWKVSIYGVSNIF